ncbi:MAG TPA: hypothetical protein EYQ57_03655 [Methylococcaceae bacterium]|nr:hypothetical protein [Methylococcaceae bacterium]
MLEIIKQLTLGKNQVFCDAGLLGNVSLVNKSCGCYKAIPDSSKAIAVQGRRKAKERSGVLHNSWKLVLLGLGSTRLGEGSGRKRDVCFL